MKDGRLLTWGTVDRLKLECFGNTEEKLEKVYMHHFGGEQDEYDTF